MKKLFMLFVVGIASFFVFNSKVYADSVNCPMWEEELDGLIEKADNEIYNTYELLEDGYYATKTGEFNEKINVIEGMYNDAYGFYDMHLDHCSFSPFVEADLSHLYNQMITLSEIDPVEYIPACEYLGTGTIALIQKIFDIIKILVPALLVLLGSFDLAKAVLAGDEKDMKLAQKSLLQRTLAAIAIFFAPAVINLVLSFMGITGGTCSVG